MMEAHFFSMIIIGIGSFAFGILPMAFSLQVRRSNPFFLSLILCLGAGVLLSTSLVHMLAEVQQRLKLYAQLYFCVGLLCLYTFDEISHYCLDVKKLEVHSVSTENQKRNSYGATQHSESSPFLNSSQSKLPSEKHKAVSNEEHFERSQFHSQESHQNFASNSSHSENNDENQTVSHLAEGEHWSHNSATKTGLFISLLIHSILEGISIGVQTKISQILLILGAVTFHKIVLSFCLGLELNQYGYTKLHLFVAIFFFSIGSPVGILLGMTVASLENGVFGIDAELQAIAAGSLLYVALLEVLPRERSKWRTTKKGGGILQLIFLLIGFATITSFHFFYWRQHEEHHKKTQLTEIQEVAMDCCSLSWFFGLATVHFNVI